MTQVIITKTFGHGTKTFRFANVTMAMNFANENMSKLVDILDANDNSILF